MVSKKKVKKIKVDQQLLDDINKLINEWMKINSIIERSYEPSETSYFTLKVAKAKYFFLLREARIRGVSARR